jgi:endonuclease-3
MNRKERANTILSHFRDSAAPAETELHYSNPFELLIAVVLSAQCTDKRINQVTPALFARFPDVHSLASAGFEEVFSMIRSVSYPNNKAKHLIALAKMLESDFSSEVPASVEELQKLPGVGRKTANVIASVVHSQPTMAVDTHVFRVSHRLGLVPETARTPLAVELALYQVIPKDEIPKAHHWLILHGRYVCLARRPLCETCGLKTACRYFQKNPLSAKSSGKKQKPV